jgi:hypothetical protein
MFEHRAISTIAAEIRKDWSSQRADKKVPIHADVYLRPMETLTSISDNYHRDTAVTVVLYFLTNATTWKGETAKRIKKELKAILALKGA